jgi:hypothetical protein
VSRKFAPPAVLAIIAGSSWGASPAFTELAVQLGVATNHSTSGFVHAGYAGGGAVGDFNNDGCQDLFVISGGVGNRPDKLYINNCDGTFTEAGVSWGLTAHLGKGAAVGDIDKDGWLDLYVTSAGPVGNDQPGHHKLYRNNGDNTFTDVAAAAGVKTTAVSQEDGWGASFGDYDLDGDLDLMVGGFAPSNEGNRLFRNDGLGTFTNVTAAIGLFAGEPGMYCFSPRLVDMDGDRYPDLLMVADFGTSQYYRNNANGTFTRITGNGACLEENGMGVNTGDFNSDGRLDFYATSIYFPANGWTGNKLYLNLGGHDFVEVAGPMGVADGGYGWGALAVDFNHDGRLDLAETNGDDNNSGPFFNEPSYLWIQNPNGTFTEMHQACNFIQLGKGRGMVNVDYDNDGDQDAVIFANNERLYFFRNDVAGPDARWLRVFLDTSNSPGLAPNGVGATVKVTVGAQSQYRYVQNGDIYLSHGELSAHFGLGAAAVVDELRVEWPDGTTTVQTAVPTNQTLTILSAAALTPGDLDQDGDVDVVDFLALLQAWGPCPGTCPPSCPADITGDCAVGIQDFLLLLQNWG